MKTAISIDNGLLREADETAQALGVSRSRLFALALAGFLEQQRQAQMLRRLNEVYADGPRQAEVEAVRKMKAKTGGTIKDRW